MTLAFCAKASLTACLICLYVLAAVAEGPPVSGEGDVSANETATALPQDELDTIRAFVEQTLGLDIERVDVEGFRPEPSPSDPEGTASRRIRDIDVTCGNANKPLSILYDTETGVICAYSSRNEDPEYARNLGHDRAFSAESAFRSAIRVLQYYGLSTQLRDYCRLFMDGINLGRQDDLYGAEWRFYRVLSYKGMPCRGSMINIFVSAVDGRLSLFNYRPVIAPEPCEFKVSQDQALVIAEKWCRSAGRDIQELNVDDVRQVIASPGFFAGPDGKITVDFSAPTKSFYCWEVPFVFSPGSFPLLLWVRMDTGEVIGNGARLMTSGDGFCCE